MSVASMSIAEQKLRAPRIPLYQLDSLWFQVSGTVCNLWCTHCFISCSPKNHAFGFMSRSQVRSYLDESVALGVKEYYFTGGEPFMNRDMLGILKDTLALGPATVLSNGLLITPKVAHALQELSDNSPYTLEMRISLDGFTAASNDAIRGDGSFARAMAGVRNLVSAGFLPIITCMQSWDDSEHDRVLRGFMDSMRAIGYDRPRLKILPQLHIGREAERSRSYTDAEMVTEEMMIGYDPHLLLCSTGRMVTDRGVYVCPILIENPDARLGDTLADSFRPYPMKHRACFTCYLSGAICMNFSAAPEV